MFPKMDLFTAFLVFIVPLLPMMLCILPSAEAAFAATVTTNRRTFVLSSFGFLFSKKDEDIFDFGPYRDGTVKVARNDNGGDKLFSLYYRLYNPDSKETPLVICHGGP
jgi:hypothetical protein